MKNAVFLRYKRGSNSQLPWSTCMPKLLSWSSAWGHLRISGSQFFAASSGTAHLYHMSPSPQQHSQQQKYPDHPALVFRELRSQFPPTSPSVMKPVHCPEVSQTLYWDSPAPLSTRTVRRCWVYGCPVGSNQQLQPLLGTSRSPHLFFRGAHQFTLKLKFIH